MCGLMKSLVRLGVIGALVTGGAVVIAGPHRVAALAQQIRSKVATAIDSQIDDPVALRQQLRDLEAKYPRRIAEVRSQLAEIQEQIRQTNRERAVSERVVTMASNDLTELKSLLARAEEARVTAASDGVSRTVAISFNDRRFTVDEAYSRANYIGALLSSYEARIVDADRDLTSLSRDQERLTTLLTRLDAEQTQFQAQLAQLDRQIDSVARKERMVELMAERQARIDELSRYHVASLDQFKSVLAKRQAELESRIESLTNYEYGDDYVSQAEFQVDTKAPGASADPAATITIPSMGSAPEIEISDDDDCATHDHGPVASRVN